MNSVHKLGSRIMSKNLTQEKYRVELGQKQAECTECTAQSQPQHPSRAPSACLLRAPCAFRLRVRPHPRARSHPHTRSRARTPAAPAPTPQRLPAHPARPAERLPPCAPQRPRLRAPWSYRGLAGHCIAIQSSLAYRFKLQYNVVYCNTLLPASSPLLLQYKPTGCNTIFPLGCNTKPVITIQSLLEPATFQPPSLQYKPCLAYKIFIFTI